MILNNFFVCGVAISNFTRLNSSNGFTNYSIVVEVDNKGKSSPVQVFFYGKARVNFDYNYLGKVVAIGGRCNSYRTSTGYATTLIGSRIATLADEPRTQMTSYSESEQDMVDDLEQEYAGDGQENEQLPF